MSQIIKSSLIGRKCVLCLLSAIAFILSNYAAAQNFVWARTEAIDYTLNPELLNYTVAANGSGNVYFAGLKTFSGIYSNEAFGDNFFNKYDSEGNQLFTRLFEGECVMKNMFATTEGHVLLVGLIRSNVEFGPGNVMTYTGNGTNAFMVRFTSGGTVSWMKNLSALYGFADQVRGISTDDQNNIYIAYNDNTNANSVIKKFDSEGNELMTIQQTSVAYVSSIDVDPEGNIVAAGSCPSSTATFGGVPYNSGFNYALYVAKYNSQGETQWVKFVEDITCQIPRIRCSPTGDIYFSGELYDNFNFGTIPTNGPAWVYDFFLAKMDTDGNFEWVKEVPQTTDGDAAIGKLNHLSLDYYGNPYISGFTRGQVVWDDNWQSDVVNRGIISITYTSGGEYRWVKYGDGGWEAQSIAAFSPEDIYLAGTALGQMQLDDITVLPTGLYYPFLAKIEAVTTQTGTLPFISPVEIYPNPVKEKCTVKSSKMISELEILSFEGAVVLSAQQIFSEKLTIEAGDLERGIYLVRVKLSDGSVSLNKLVVIR